MADGFYCNGLVLVSDEPVQLCRRHFFVKRRAQQAKRFHFFLGFGSTGALAKNPRDQFILCHIVRMICRSGGVAGVAHKVQPSHAKPLFVDGIIKKRVALGNVCSADHGVVLCRYAHVQK